MALDKQRILSELGSVMTQLQSADCGCMGKLFNGQGQGQPQGNPLPTCGGCRRGCCAGHGMKKMGMGNMGACCGNMGIMGMGNMSGGADGDPSSMGGGGMGQMGGGGMGQMGGGGMGQMGGSGMGQMGGGGMGQMSGGGIGQMRGGGMGQMGGSGGMQSCLGGCNPPKLYADTYGFLQQNLMKPVMDEVYNDLKSITPENTVGNNPIAAQMGLSPGSGGPMGGNPGMGGMSGNPGMGNDMGPGFTGNPDAMRNGMDSSKGNPMAAQIMNMMMGGGKGKAFNIQGQGGAQPMGDNQMGMPGQGMGGSQTGDAGTAGFGNPQTQYVSGDQVFAANTQGSLLGPSAGGMMSQPGSGMTERRNGMDPSKGNPMAAQTMNMMMSGGEGKGSNMQGQGGAQTIGGNQIGMPGQGMAGPQTGGAVTAGFGNPQPQFVSGDQVFPANTQGSQPGAAGMMSQPGSGVSGQQMTGRPLSGKMAGPHIHGPHTLPAVAGSMSSSAAGGPYGQHTPGMKKFSEMFPGVMGGDLGFDPMAIAFQMNPANQKAVAMDTIAKIMSPNSRQGLMQMQPAMTGATVANAQLAQQLPPELAGQLGQGQAEQPIAPPSTQAISPTRQFHQQGMPAQPTASMAGQPGQLMNQQGQAVLPASHPMYQGQVQQVYTVLGAPTMAGEPEHMYQPPGQPIYLPPDTPSRQVSPTRQMYRQLSPSSRQSVLGDSRQSSPTRQTYSDAGRSGQPMYQRSPVSQSYQALASAGQGQPIYEGQEQVYSATGAPPGYQYSSDYQPLDNPEDDDLPPPPPDQIVYKEPIFPAERKYPKSLPSSHKYAAYYNTLGQPVEPVPATLYKEPEQSGPVSLSWPEPGQKKFNVKPTMSKTSIAGSKPLGDSPSRSQMQHYYRQIKSAQGYKPPPPRTSANQLTASDGRLNPKQAAPNPQQPVERVGDTVANNLVMEVMKQPGKDIQKPSMPHGDVLKEPVKPKVETTPALDKKLRNGLQDVNFKRYMSNAWTFHGTCDRPVQRNAGTLTTPFIGHRINSPVLARSPILSSIY